MAGTELAARPVGIDTVAVARISAMLNAGDADAPGRLFSATEIEDAGQGRRRAERLAARLAAKEACLKLFPRETALGHIEAADFSVRRDACGAPHVECSRRARIVLGRHRVARIALSLTHDRERACAIATIEHDPIPESRAGRFLYRWLPLRRAVVLENLERVFGGRISPKQIEALAASHYGHLLRLIGEFLVYPFIPARKRLAMARVENLEALLDAHGQGRGVLILTGHFGNFEVGTATALAQFPEAHGRFHFVRRPFKPRWLDDYVTRRARRAGLGMLPKKGSLDWLLKRLEQGEVVVFPFDQHAVGHDGVVVDFFGHPAGTFRSLALLAEASGAPVVPASNWREPDGRHVLRFEERLALSYDDDFGRQVRRNTRLFNQALEELVVRHPEQWWWTHRRWKPAGN